MLRQLGEEQSSSLDLDQRTGRINERPGTCPSGAFARVSGPVETSFQALRLRAAVAQLRWGGTERTLEQFSDAALMRITMGRPEKAARGMSNPLMLPDGK